ncbi:hypothetical protein [Gimesia sp.]|uniref:hypothetical protein n=1 Tax=Gimesia sp. TaxID=2024833 RepID=UPI000C445AD9|nr:hypothetical protein [Gimesia sp.]MAX39427.1 hypothetical protein [Gimesia sp.]HAH46363.1 hypothetical protein [Planctomycetaceae bacterium]HBL45064.1 hypothetical protein [Planctomycetaceae bacterium]|tara:strand:- start:6656 stop:6985 length:330 start_codon:yes stop_codon:yes gene_type:complete
MTSEAVKMMVLQTVNQEHLGFTLFHPDLSQSTGDCVFMIVPQNPELLESAEVALFQSMKEAGEHQWAWSESDLLISRGDEIILKYRGDGFIDHVATGTRLGRWATKTPA